MLPLYKIEGNETRKINSVCLVSPSFLTLVRNVHNENTAKSM